MEDKQLNEEQFTKIMKDLLENGYLNTEKIVDEKQYNPTVCFIFSFFTLLFIIFFIFLNKGRSF